MLLIGSEGTLDFNVDPEGKVYEDRSWSNGGRDHGAQLMMAKEYPVGSGLVVACGGLNRRKGGFPRTFLSLRQCERYVDVGIYSTGDSAY